MRVLLKFIFAIAYILLGAFQVSALDNTATRELGFETLWRGNYGTYETTGNLVIKNENNWQETWEALPADIDFDDEMLVAVFMGTRNTGGYAIEIITVLETPEHLKVRLKHSAPGKDALVTQALVQPHHIVRLGKSDKPVIFKNHDAER